MSVHSKPRALTFKAGGAITANSFVKFGSADDTVVLAGAGERAIGVSVAAAASAEKVEVHCFGGGSKVKLSATVTRGNFLKSNASGLALKGAAAGDFCAAMAMESGVSGDVVAVELAPVVVAAAEV